MSQRWINLLPYLIIALLLPAAVAAAGGAYITGVADDTKEYKHLRIQTVDTLDPMDVSLTQVTLKSTESGDLAQFEYPLFGNVVRTFDPASGRYHGVQMTAHESGKTIDGSTIPCEYLFYVKPTIPSFTVNVPGETGNVLLIKVPSDLPPGATFEEIFKAAAKEGYLFKNDAIIYMNKTGFTAWGAISSGDYDKDNLAYTLANNEVNLAGFTTDSSLARTIMRERPYTRPVAGEYLATAVKFDGATETMHVLAAMPVVILDGNQAVGWTGDNPYYQNLNKDVTISFTGADTVAYALIKDGARYGLSMTVDTVELAKQPIPVTTADLIDILKTIAGSASPVAYTLTVDGVPTGVTTNTGFAIAEGYGCSGYASASSVTITAAALKELNPGAYSLYAMGVKDDKVIAIDEKTITVAAAAPAPQPTRTSFGGSGSGSSKTAPTTETTGTGSLTTSADGATSNAARIAATDGVASLFVPEGVIALDRNGEPVTEISIQPAPVDAVPGIPAGALFQFAGYTYEAGPDGATFDPAITLTFDIPDELWNSLDLATEQFTVKWYNAETGIWEDVQTAFSPETRTVRATVTHFSIYALFTEPIAAATPIETAVTTPTGEAPAAEGLPTTMIIFAVIIIVIIAAGVYLFVVKKE